ncbi:hypothetical protein [Pseudohongiella spirulinae]|uniref:Membrane protein n=1 Tax=Pseudohongiella spirulinae TaxID=1249552 RepID=A0A0S2KGF3_9GAMM|nr:hypothetical protein [Pseudohongiella spirulinae]ALO47354.1 Membrane protein [Pseudohongiella spirulinae]
MVIIHQSAFYLHVLAGAAGLLLFWIPVFARKGSLNHRRVGRWFAGIMYTVGFSGLVMASLDLLAPLITHPASVELSTEQLNQRISTIRDTALFLWSLSVLVITTTRHGWLTINCKEQRDVLRRPAHVLLCTALLMVGITLIALGAIRADPLLLIFGALETWLGGGFLHYIFKKQLSFPKEWWTEHLGALIGSGIGAYTAFFVFGGSNLFEPWLNNSFSGLSVVLWVAPGVIGGIAIGWQTAHYRRKFTARSPSS